MLQSTKHLKVLNTTKYSMLQSTKSYKVLNVKKYLNVVCYGMMHFVSVFKLYFMYVNKYYIFQHLLHIYK